MKLKILAPEQIEGNKKEILDIFAQYVHRDGIEKLLDYLVNKSDFFIAPASTRFHGSYDGGLAQHSLNVYHCFKAYLERERAAGRVQPGAAAAPADDIDAPVAAAAKPTKPTDISDIDEIFSIFKR